MSKTYHVSLDIMSACEWPTSRLAGLLVDRQTGRELTGHEARRVLLQHLSEGRKFLPAGECEGFDYKTGCPGHEKSSTEGLTLPGEGGITYGPR